MFLKTDFYQLAMIAGYIESGLSNKIVTCEAFARKLPSSRKFLIMSGTEEIRKSLLSINNISDGEIEYILNLPFIKKIKGKNFERWLYNFRDNGFSGEMWAMSEGEIVFPGEPLIRITAPLPEAQLVETLILSILNHDIKIASKAARIVLSSLGRDVFDFGTRRTHPDAAINAARAAYLAGFAGTSNVNAGFKYNIPVVGTMAHMWVMVNNNEQDALNKFGNLFKGSTLLIDTYNPINGLMKAIKVKGIGGVRLDSGNLFYLTKEVRKILDLNNLRGVKIVVSGDLDEYSILELLNKNCPIDAFGIGTKLVTSPDAASLGIVYKVVQDETLNKPLIKISETKTTMPGKKQVFLDQRNGSWKHLVAIDGEIKPCSDLNPLLECHICDGKGTNNIDLEIARKYCNANLISLASLPLYKDLSSLNNDDNIIVPVEAHESLKKSYENAYAIVKGELN